MKERKKKVRERKKVYVCTRVSLGDMGAFRISDIKIDTHHDETTKIS